MSCDLCRTTPEPDNYADPRTCAFRDDGTFRAANWNCETMRVLRSCEMEEPSRNGVWIRLDDETMITRMGMASCAEIDPNGLDPEDFYLPGTKMGFFLVMRFYKSRGTVPYLALSVDSALGKVFCTPTYGQIKAVLAALPGAL